MRKRRAIIFEDEALQLRLYSDLFLSKGYDVLAYSEPVICPIHAENAEAATGLDPCADILITDYTMPRMNGLDLLRAQSGHGCSLPMKNKALISGQEKVRQKALELGCAFFEKPVDRDDLEEWIAECEQRTDLSRPLAAPRKEERYVYSQEIPCLVLLGDKIMDVTAVNSSRSGLCLKLAMPLLTEQQIRVHTKLSIASPAAAVRWVSRLADGTYLVGLKYN